jgi:plasmid stabilization system protein ParE
MRINQQEKFKREFKQILEYIAKDKISSAKIFKKELIQQIDLIPNFPYKYAASKYINDKNIRDMTFNGYTVIYRIEDNTIEILTIFNQNLPIL